MRPSVHLRAFGVTSIGVAGGNDSWSDENGSAGCDVIRAAALTRVGVWRRDFEVMNRTRLPPFRRPLKRSAEHSTYKN